MRYELFLALKYLGGLRRSHPFVSVIAGISVLGVALGVGVLLVVLGVMTGFDRDLEAKIVGTNPHLIVQREGGILGSESLLETIQLVDGVEAAAPFVQTEALLKTENRASGVLLRGLDPVREPGVTELARSLRDSSNPKVWPPGENELIVGSQLAQSWGLRPEDSVTVILGGKPPVEQSMKVIGEFTTGMYDYDAHLVIASLETVQQLLKQPGVVSGVGVRLKRAMEAASMKEELQRKLRFPYWVMSWMDLNKNLFAALALEKATMFVILTLIVLVACFNIAATLLMMVVGKIKDVGILKSIGATNRSIRRIFTWAGLLIGLTGTALGTALGLGLCAFLKKYPIIRLPPSVYYIDRLPVKLEWSDGISVVLAAIGISLVASLYPAWVAGRLSPAQAVRYE